MKSYEKGYDERRTAVVKSYSKDSREYKIRLGKMIGKIFPPFKILEFNDVYASNYRFKATCVHCGYIGVYQGSKIKHGTVACKSCRADASNKLPQKLLTSPSAEDMVKTMPHVASEAYIAEFKKMNEHLSEIAKELREISYSL